MIYLKSCFPEASNLLCHFPCLFIIFHQSWKQFYYRKCTRRLLSNSLLKCGAKGIKCRQTSAPGHPLLCGNRTKGGRAVLSNRREDKAPGQASPPSGLRPAADASREAGAAGTPGLLQGSSSCRGHGMECWDSSLVCPQT